MSHLQVFSRTILHIVLQFFFCLSRTIADKKTVRHKNCKTICTIVLENTWRRLIRVETCSQNNYICYIEVKQIYHIVVSTEIYCRFTINRLPYHITGWLLVNQFTPDCWLLRSSQTLQCLTLPSSRPKALQEIPLRANRPAPQPSHLFSVPHSPLSSGNSDTSRGPLSGWGGGGICPLTLLTKPRSKRSGDLGPLPLSNMAAMRSALDTAHTFAP